MKIDIIIGFNLPSKNVIEEIVSNINNNIINQYRQNVVNVSKNKKVKIAPKNTSVRKGNNMKKI